MAKRNLNRSSKNPSKSNTIPTKRKPEAALNEDNSTKKSHKKNKNTCASNSAKGKKGGEQAAKSCHQCRTPKDIALECTKCHSKRYCIPCINKWYPDVSQEEFVNACPFCCRNCNCKACLRRFSIKDMQQVYSCSESDKIQYSKQILQKVYPLVKRLNDDQLIEKKLEAKVKGVSISELQIQDAECEVDDDIYCDRCGSYFFDFYRSCACGYDLCLMCCKDLRGGQLKDATCGWKAHVDGSIPCPPKDIGGCNDGTLELKRVMCVNRIVDLLEKAQGVYKINYGYENPQTFAEFGTNHLYSLSGKDIQPQHMQRFQSHWSKGEPIIVNDVLPTSSGLSWEPMVLWRAFRDITKSRNHSMVCEVHAINCLDWSEVSIDLSKFCSGYSASQYNKHGLPLILKLEDWQPSCVSQGEWPRHFAEFVNCLPFKDYTDPDNGYLNVAVKLPDQSLKPDMGPKMDIAYGLDEELEYGNSVTKLHYEKSDTVNVMTHTKSNVLNNTNMVKQKYDDRHETLVCEAGSQRSEGQQSLVDQMKVGAVWDIFQRQDVPKLEQYLRNHSAEFRHTGCLPVDQRWQDNPSDRSGLNNKFESTWLIHPIHDRTFYLNMEHKRRLKQELGIEPWTFEQKLGDAVFIPAGCPYQVRNLKSSTKVELNFISPESLGECIRLQKELCMLPKDHKAKQQKLNIGKIMIYALDHAVTELSGFIDPVGPNDDLQHQLAKGTEILNGDCMNINNHTNGWVYDSESDDDSQDTVDSVEHLSITIEDSCTSEEPAGLWHGNDVGQAAKEMLQAVEHRYPDTFRGVQIRSTPLWLLKQLHVFIEGFLETSVDTLAEDKIYRLEDDLSVFDRLGFDLSWVRKRLEMVKNVKFGNDPLRLELMVLEESLESAHKELVETKERLNKAQQDYDKARDARNKKVHEVTQKFGAKYDDVLNGNLGLGMLPGY